MKHSFYHVFEVFLLASVLLSACVVTPEAPTDTPSVGTPLPLTDTPVVVTQAPVTDTPVVVTATDTLTASPSPTTQATLTPTPVLTPTPGGLPDMPVKPEPQSSTFQGCPPQGDGGDPQLNLLKNRIDEGNYVPVTFDAILNLTWPKTTERRKMDTWSPEDAAAIAQYEGIPVVVEGYLWGARQSGSESTNCHATSSDMTDWHLWLTKNPGEDRTHSIVIETTPRIRAIHQWTLKMVEQIAKDQTPVRISGWLFFDPEHPDQVLKTRGTIWEVHPIMQIEVLQNNQWVPLDQLAP